MHEDKLTAEQEKLVEDNIKLVHYIIHKYVTLGEDEYEDLFQEGAYYLVKAAKNFDESKGKFSSFASEYIANGLKTYKRHRSNKYHGLKISRNTADVIYKVSSYSGNIEDITDEELTKMDLTKKDIQKCMINVESMQKEIVNNREDNSIEVVDTIEDKKSTKEMIDVIHKIQDDEIIEIVMDNIKSELKSKYHGLAKAYVLSICNNDKISHAEMSKQFGISRAYTNRIIRRIKQIIRLTILKYNKNNDIEV